MTTLTEKFLEGLKNYGLTYEDIIKSGWKYCGGNQGHHFNYYKLLFNTDKKIEPQDRCVCGHFIKENCYICDREHKEILVLGLSLIHI